MYLTKEEERILEGEEGEVLSRFMKLLVKIGDKFKAEKLILVSSVQIAGISYKNIGDPGVGFLEEIAKSGVKARVTSFMNPAGMDLEAWREMGVSENFARNQMRIVNALKSMDVVPSATCTPYLAGMLPRFREHIAWSESSAVIFANSVLGARTNREGAFTALASALLGKTPYYGLHLEENRKPTFVVRIESEIEGESDFSALAYFVCKSFKKGVPLFESIKKVSVDELKLLGASLAAYGAFALFHAAGITPESGIFSESEIKEKIVIEERDLREAREEMESEAEPEIIALGCPHASIKEIEKIFSLVKDKKPEIPVWIFTSRVTKKLAQERFGRGVEEVGIKIFADTCPVVAPLKELGIKSVATNSGKMRFYLLNQGIEVYFGSMEKLFEKFSG